MISFFADKTVTTGEGGVVLTDDDAFYRRLRLLRNQGREHSGTFVHESLGMNFRVTDMQCAVGNVQLQKLPEIVARKRHNYARYVAGLADVDGVRLQTVQDGSTFVPFRFAMLTDRKAEVAAALETAGNSDPRLLLPASSAALVAEVRRRIIACVGGALREGIVPARAHGTL